ncbi:putative bifunctional diguanylate cyclase/phosphodiesterase [Pseudomarimonas salicorniae]|uniref:EAL domain-containing protein n=1 Tax=Pseudomarimonas salicorniae TaxID=2933270 RepID=A0ABT0GJH3_9GAMM|nr:EAL domain-containing protein [Lysobacter sp. CAU 1642]MCK7594683.1 EAL domain-containing protein [Lysobacter sp. CAU 1642]
MLAIIVSFQITVLVATRYAVSTAVDQQLHRQLEVGSRVWAQSHGAQLVQLTERLLVLADDFGFKQAVATEDPPTLRSVLANQTERLGAQYGLLLDAEGMTTASHLPDGAELRDADLGLALEAARQQGFAAGVLALSGRPIRYALAPVFAPDLVGWVAVGEEMGRESLGRFESITGLDAALALGSDCRVVAQSPALAAFDSPQGFCATLSSADSDHEWAQMEGLAGRALRAERLTRDGSAPVWLLMSSAREQALQPFAGLQSRALWLGLLAALITLAVASWIGTRVSRPVAQLADAATRMRQGDYEAPVEARGDDEIGQLARAFTRMQRAIGERERRILHQATHDGLTDLPNRDQALHRLTLAMEAKDGAVAHGAVVRVDIRRFREVNNLLGQAFGDEVLVRCAERLKGAVRGQDLVARVGSNEFLLLMYGIGADDAQARVERLVAAMKAPLVLSRTELALDVYVGVALFPEDAIDAAQLLRRSDIALGAAKRGGQVISFYQKGSEEAHLRRLRLIGDLRHAESRGELQLVFQPQMAVLDERPVHAEALLRWRHPELGFVPPDEFVALAEHAGLIPSITRFVIGRALQQLDDWRLRGIDCGVAINLSALDLSRQDLPETVLGLISKYRIAPELLVIEVTESAMMQDLEQSIATLHKLRSAGIPIAVDDFGTGQSTLAQLKRLPVDQLKIDKSFVMALRAGTDDERIVSSIVQLAHALALVVVAEGVETEEGLEVLRRQGCELAQGYLHSRPLEPEEFARWWGERRRKERVAAHGEAQR